MRAAARATGRTSPDGVDGILRGFARALAPGGGLLLGFFEGPRVEPFEHVVTTAWFWPVATMRALLERAGFEIQEVEQRTDDGHRPHAAVVARRRDV